MRVYLENKDTSFLGNVVTNNYIVMIDVTFVLSAENEKFAANWLLNLSNNLDKRKELIKAITEYFNYGSRESTVFLDF